MLTEIRSTYLTTKSIQFMTAQKILIFTIFSLLATCMTLPAGAGKKEKDKRAKVRIETSQGVVTVALFDETPIHRDNFLKLVREGYYDGLLFHRVIRDFMIQSGDPNSRNAAPGQKLGEGGPGYTLPAEIRWPDLYHYRGVLAAAREGDDANPERRSSGSQFYIVWGRKLPPLRLKQAQAQLDELTDGAIQMNEDQRNTYELEGGTPHLDGQYTIFGEVIDGLKIVKEIQKVQTDSNDRPLTDIFIRKATVIQESGATEP